MKLRIYKISLILTIIILLISAQFKISHWPGGNLMGQIGLSISLIFILIAFFDIFKRETIKPFVKIIWILGFIILNWIVGIIYYKRVIKKAST